MSVLIINIVAEDLSSFDPIGTNTYEAFVKFFNSQGQPLNNPNIPNEAPVQFTTTGNQFSIEVEIVTGTYAIPDVTIMVFANEDSDCCFGQKTVTIINNGGVVIVNSLGLGGYYADDSGDNFRIRVADGSSPYNGFARNFAGNVIHTFSNIQADELSVPNTVMNDLVDGITIEITDANNNTGTIQYDTGTLYAMKRYLVGFSVSNGNPDNHVAKIIEGNQREFSLTGVMAECSDIHDDAQLIGIENDGEFDADLPLPNPPVYAMDKTIKALVEQDKCDIIRLNYWFKRAYFRLNNGTTRTAFIGKADAQMRPDGVTPIVREAGGELGEFFDVIIPSYASPNLFNMACRLILMFFNRYPKYINLGHVAGIGSVVVTSGEGEACSVFTIGESQIESVNGTIYSKGDFNQYSMAIFRDRFPQHNGSDNNAIANAPDSSELAIDWKAHNNQIIIDFENKLADFINANAAKNKRKKWVQKDSGSFVDGQAAFRQTLNAIGRAKHPSTFLWKSNDNSNEPALKVDFYLDHLSTLARISGGIAICEPSPPNYEDPENTGYLVTESQKAKERGIGVSYYTPNGGVASNITSLAGLSPGSIPKNKNEFKTINGHKKLVRHSLPLSQVLQGGGFGGSEAWLNSWAAFRSSQGVASVDTRTIDDVNPNDDDDIPSYSSITNYLNNNLPLYGGNIIFDIDKSSGNIYNYREGSYTRSDQLETMSFTKAVTAAVILSVMQDFGSLTLDTTASSLIPSWNHDNLASVTLRHIIGHTNGIQETGDFAGGDWTLESAVDGLGGRALEFNPGSQFKYSTTSYQVAARMAEIVSGQTWKQLFEARIRDKCGMGNAEYMPAASPNPNPNAGYGLFCSHNEYRNFMSMIRNNGTYAGQSILNSNSMNLIKTDMTLGLGNWGFGVIRKEISGSFANEIVCESSKGMYAWINFQKNISAVLSTQVPNADVNIGANNGLRDLVRNTIGSNI